MSWASKVFLLSGTCRFGRPGWKISGAFYGGGYSDLVVWSTMQLSHIRLLLYAGGRRWIFGFGVRPGLDVGSFKPGAAIMLGSNVCLTTFARCSVVWDQWHLKDFFHLYIYIYIYICPALPDKYKGHTRKE